MGILRGREIPQLRWKRLIATAGLVVGLVWLGISAWAVLTARAELDSGRAYLVEVMDAYEQDSDEDQSFDDVVVQQITKADHHLQRASRRLDSWYLDPWRVVPIAGRQLSSARHISARTAAVVSTATDIVHLADGYTTDAGDRSLGDINAQLLPMLTTLVEQSDNPDFGPNEGLVGPLADARIEAEERMAELHPMAKKAWHAVHGLNHFLGEDNRYVLLASNNAEMQVSGGMVLSVGDIASPDGALAIDHIESVDLLFPIRGAGVVDEDVAATWGRLAPGNDYRKLGYSARFNEWSGPQAVAMREAQTGRSYDGAILVDVMALEALVALVGEIEVEGRIFTAESIRHFLLIEQYEEFDDRSEERRDYLAVLASEVFERLSGGDVDPIQLLRTLNQIVDGRHLMVFAVDEEIQQSWEYLEAAGGISPNTIGINLAALLPSKLDPFIEMEVTGSMSVNPNSRDRIIELVVDLRNTVNDPSQLSDYAIGPWEVIGLDAAGTHLGRLAITVPSMASEVQVSPAPRFEINGPDGPVTIMAYRLEIAPGATQRQIITITIPEDRVSSPNATLVVVPTARPSPVQWHWNGEQFSDHEPVELGLG